MMKKSTGILVYKVENKKIKVLLCHLGGPFWSGKDIGAWSLAKGEVLDKENALSAAKREFKEETNLDVCTDINFLASKKVSNRKLVVMFYTNSDFDLSQCKSNDFELEFPRKSGKIEKFPEMDKYEWMDILRAKEMIIASQVYFLDKLEEKLHN